MIKAVNLQLMRGTKTLLQQTEFTIFPGQRVGFVGANGAGKSSLFALIRGEIKQDHGELSLPKDWRMAHVAQETPALSMPALQYVVEGDAEYKHIRDQLTELEAQTDASGHQIATLHARLDAVGGYQIEARAATILAGLGFSPEQINLPVESFSGGWRMRLNLARALIARADLLLLDEPTNHLDLDAIYWLESWLKRFEGTLLLISHDRDFLDGTVEHIFHIENQQIHTYSGHYSSFQRQRSERLRQAQLLFENEQQKKAHLQKFIDRFRAKASKARQAQSRIKALEKLTATAPLEQNSPYDLTFPKPSKLPNPLIRLDNVQAGYDDKVILKQIKLNLVPGTRIGLLGRNGAGKSTLTKLLAGELPPMQGDIHLSAGLKVGYFAQHQLELLSLKESPMAHLIRVAQQDLEASAATSAQLPTEQALRDYLGRFGFQGDRVFEPVGPFSGGEKSRLVLALLIYQKPNLLLLDEPTNHLDLDMRSALIAALQEFEGALVVVSHDRYFLNATLDEFYLVAHQQVEPFKGDLDDYSKWLQQDAAQSATNKKADGHGERGKSGEGKPATKTSNDEPPLSRKEQRQQAAAERERLRPLQQKRQKIEQHMQQLENQLAELNTFLADPALYQGNPTAELTEKLKLQGQVESQLEALELDWFEVEEALEALRNES